MRVDGRFRQSSDHQVGSERRCHQTIDKQGDEPGYAFCESAYAILLGCCRFCPVIYLGLAPVATICWSMRGVYKMPARAAATVYSV